LQQIYSGNGVLKFHQNRPSFIEDITKKHFGLFFSGHTVDLDYMRVSAVHCKAFDAVRHTTLLQKFAQLDIPGAVYN